MSEKKEIEEPEYSTSVKISVCVLAGIFASMLQFAFIYGGDKRGEYVDGDPRYYRKSFHCYDKREQVELWAEKEYRSLSRAFLAGIPCPKPLLQKQNILFMKFLGNGGWPCPQL